MAGDSDMTITRRLPSPAMEAALCRPDLVRFSDQIREYAWHIATTRQLADHTVRNYINDLVPLVEYLGDQRVIDRIGFYSKNNRCLST